MLIRFLRVFKNADLAGKAHILLRGSLGNVRAIFFEPTKPRTMPDGFLLVVQKPAALDGKGYCLRGCILCLFREQLGLGVKFGEFLGD